jgi:hypothetical protein
MFFKSRLNEWINDNDPMIMIITNDNASINELLIDYNRNEKQSLNKYKQVFRVESGQLIIKNNNNNNNNSRTNNVITSISASSLMDSQSSSTTTTNTDVIKPLLSDVDYSDIEDQIDAKRAYKHKEGICILDIDPDGLFWIKPILDEKSSLFNDFNLIEQIQMNSKRLCWYTELIDQHGKIVNYELVQFAMNNETAPPIIIDRFKLIQLVRDKCKVYYSKSEQQSICSIATTPTTTIQPAISLPTEHVHRTKHKQKAKNNLNKKNGLNQPLRCKSKSFDQILTNNTDNNVTNNNYNTANTNEKYHTIASGAGIAASAAVLVQAV